MSSNNEIKKPFQNDEGPGCCIVIENAIFIPLFTLLLKPKMHCICHGDTYIIYACITSDMWPDVLKTTNNIPRCVCHVKPLLILQCFDGKICPTGP